MMAAADTGGYFLLPEYNASTTAVREYEVAAPYEDEEAQRLLLRRTRARRVLAPAAVEDCLAGESTVAVCGSDAVGEANSQIGRKRRLSSRVTETLADFSKAVKKRADSFPWRKDSVVPPAVLLGARVNESSPVASPGSGERSRDGDDELSSGDEQIFRGRRLRPGNRHMRRSAQTGPVSRAQHRHVLPAPQPMLPTDDNDELERQEEEQQFIRENSSHHLVMMEREVRIAERQGAFSAAAREKTYKKPHQRLGSECSQQSQASVKLKAKVAKAKAKSDKEFRRWSEGRDESPISKVFSKLWRKNGRGKESMMESDPPSELESSAEGPTSSATQSSGSVWSEDSVNGRRGDNVEAAVHAGRAARQAAGHTGMPFTMF